jgi:hypothetical protein
VEREQRDHRRHGEGDGARRRGGEVHRPFLARLAARLSRQQREADAMDHHRQHVDQGGEEKLVEHRARHRRPPPRSMR